MTGDSPSLPPFPVSKEDRDRAPLRWQQSRAIQILHAKVLEYYDDESRYLSMVAAMEKWKPRVFLEEQAQIAALIHGPRNLDRLRVLVRHNVSTELYATIYESEHLRALIHLGQIVLMQSADPRVASVAETRMIEMARPQSWSQQKPLGSATATLAAMRLAVREGAVHDRYYLFVGPASKLLDSPPFVFDQNLSPDDPKEAEGIRLFENWFALHHEQLEKDAASERPRLQELLDELNGAENHWTLP